MTVAADPSSAYFAWKYYHPREAEDMQAVWGAAWRAGGRAAIQDSGRLVDLVPMLHALLELLEDGRQEAEVRASDRRPPSEPRAEAEGNYWEMLEQPESVLDAYELFA